MKLATYNWLDTALCNRLTEHPETLEEISRCAIAEGYDGHSSGPIQAAVYLVTGIQLPLIHDSVGVRGQSFRKVEIYADALLWNPALSKAA
jgi:hypothetical protein